jgi:hypothetical protein
VNDDNGFAAILLVIVILLVIELAGLPISRR